MSTALQQPLRSIGSEIASPIGGLGCPDPATRLTLPRFQLTLQVGRGGVPNAWRFVLRPADGHRVMAIEDREPDLFGEQLELLALVRGLEALDQPSAVTVFGCSRYVRHGVVHGLPEWRDTGWRWERFGQLVPIKGAELWRRVDRALQIHQLTFGTRRIDTSHGVWTDRYRVFGKRRKGGVRANFAHWVKCLSQSLLLAVVRAVPQPG